jgi:sortase A
MGEVMTTFLEKCGEYTSAEHVNCSAQTPWRRAEKALLLVGIFTLAAYAAARVHTKFSSRLALHEFSSLYVTDSGKREKLNERVDFTLWNPKRVQAYQESLLAKPDIPIAVLRIPKIHLEVPVFNGTDALTLNRGAGRIIGTAEIGQRGNIAIAAHRDGFFRMLKDIAPGDLLWLDTPGKTIHYVIGRTEVVQPEDVSVLRDTGTTSLTLVTCFPFYFIGSAPQRFIVHASSTDFDGPKSPPNELAGQIHNEGEPK